MLSATRLRLSAGLGAVLFVIGYLVVVVVPGGGSTDESDFTKFYDSDGKMFLSVLLTIVLVLAAAAITWFYIELRGALGGSVLAQLATTLGVLGAVAVPAGAAIIEAPVGVQQNSDNAALDWQVAYGFAQAGLGVMLFLGMGLIAIAIILCSLEIRRIKAEPSWLWIAGLVLGIVCLGSYIWIPGMAFPIWLLVLAATGMRPATGPAGSS